MTTIPLASIRAVVEYDWPNEEASYIELNGDDAIAELDPTVPPRSGAHVFEHLFHIDQWLMQEEAQ